MIDTPKSSDSPSGIDRCDAENWHEALVLGCKSDKAVEFFVRDQPGMVVTFFGRRLIHPKRG